MRFRSFFGPVALLVMASAAMSAAARAAVLDRLEASVNSSLILLSDVRNFRKTVKLRSQLDPLFAGTPIAAKGVSAPESMIVEFLIDEKMVAQQFPVTDQEVEQEINSIQANNRIDRANLKSALAQQGFSFDEYFELIRTSASKRNLIDRDIRTKVTISEDDIKNYFYNHYSRGSAVPTSYQLKMISFLSSNYKSPQAAREQANKAHAEIKSGEPFEEVAKRMSDDDSAAAGGDLGTLSDEQMSPAIKSQVKKLRIGEISPVFGEPDTGFFILKLVDVKSAESAKLNEKREEIRNILASSEYQHQIQLWLERQRQRAYIHRAGEPSVAGLPTQ